MTVVGSRTGLISAAALVLLGACSTNVGSTGLPGAAGSGPGSAGSSGSAGTAGSAPSGTAGDMSGGTAGGGSAGATGGAGAIGTAGTGAGPAGATGSAGSSGVAGAGGGAAGASGATGSAGSGDPGDPPAPRPINVTGTGTFSGTFNGQPLYLNQSKPIMGKLVLFLGGIGGGVGSGGIDSFVHQYGFHIFMPATNTNLTGSNVPAMYKGMNTPEANRQIGDARTDLWDGKGRVTWNTVAPGKSMLAETLAAIQYGMTNDPGGDWGYFLNTDGSLRTTDVWVVGYSWGSQTWAMVSTYIRFGRVVCTSGPVDEGWPNATWMTDPSATPEDRKYDLVGQDSPWPTQMDQILLNAMKASWPGTVTNVLPNGMPSSYTSDQHLFSMVGGNGGITPGGHTVFCNDNPANGWIPLCKYAFDQQ
ncbi:MAG TPA: hypothetical protein VLA14_02490 [Polyangia bacterium]|nr:hypothetical protein [Polyangia bacterium]